MREEKDPFQGQDCSILRDFQGLNARAAGSDLNSNVYQFCMPKSNWFDRETSVKQISFSPHFFYLGRCLLISKRDFLIDFSKKFMHAKFFTSRLKSKGMRDNKKKSNRARSGKESRNKRFFYIFTLKSNRYSIWWCSILHFSWHILAFCNFTPPKTSTLKGARIFIFFTIKHVTISHGKPALKTN